MKRLIHFFSLAVMTQAILMLSQVVLLPIQVRLWGQAATARWYSVLAIATMTYFVDLGLRTAGHAELIRATSSSFAAEDVRHFRQIWSWIRILILAFTAVLVGADFAGSLIRNTRGDFPWHAELILACAVETVLIIRIMYLDSLGRYRGAEASYFCFALMRLGLSIPALLVFHWEAPGLAAIYLGSSALALLAQGKWLCHTIPLLHLNESFGTSSWKVLALSRHTVAEQVANWTRLSLPVLLIAQIASPLAVTTYVALRAVFGAGRTTIQQLARVASVEVLKARIQNRLARGEALLEVFIALAIFFGSAVGVFVVIDNLRILGLWLKAFDRPLFQEMALAFALSAPFFGYQIPLNLMFRAGDLAGVARRHYVFILCSILFEGLSLVVRSIPIYLCLLLSAEVFLSLTFLVARGSRSGNAAIRRAGLMAAVICSVWWAARHNIGGWFVGVSFRQILNSGLLFLGLMLSLSCLFYFRHRSEIRLLRQSSEAPTS